MWIKCDIKWKIQIYKNSKIHNVSEKGSSSVFRFCLFSWVPLKMLVIITGQPRNGTQMNRKYLKTEEDPFSETLYILEFLYICISHFISHFIHIKGRWTKSTKQVVQNIIYHRLNLLKLNLKFVERKKINLFFTFKIWILPPILCPWVLSPGAAAPLLKLRPYMSPLW
jgi:hypothetical protein